MAGELYFSSLEYAMAQAKVRKKKVATKMAYSVSTLTDYSAEALERTSAELLSALKHEAAAVKSDADRKVFRDRWMARKNGILTQINDLWLKKAPKESKREAGRMVNEVKRAVEDFIEKADRVEAATPVVSGIVDITLPCVQRSIGAENPVIRNTN
jgi:phenylalanyl-tRNA synthetase alpha chain